VGVLIFFIHHVPETLNVGNITARVGRRLRRDIEALYPEDIGHENKDLDVDLTAYPLDEAVEIYAKAEGYIQTLNEEALLRAAKQDNCIIKIEYRPGDFATRGDALLRIWADETWDMDRCQTYRGAFAMGQDRTAHQNILFLADELVEILARALSPGINDPFTAINCINWFHSSMKAFLRGELPSPYRRDEEGSLRLIAYPVDFERFASVICDQSRAYISADRNTTLKMMTILTELIVETQDESHQSILKMHLKKLKDAALESNPSAPDHADIEVHFNLAQKMISDPALSKSETTSQRWIGGRG
jgi:uncharacterized membrane protein